ncbi:hypothetical protein NXE12_000955 [Vibrio fluvialis]|uniref:hypothetical protein n=1 Tax=Vibrio fluvialis TaxID=676 RepID=UPI001C9C14D8|nr:hypothetical protein [Vibrio fluvialis]EKO3420602.1 hypothetical protein [Vibrio fluvialis]ELD1798564.1 hypothetical protein [Vibrio fluvialis]MBY7935323.1 hypothetical protein [Vibrio fluvialis]MBY8046732.1 hypothetical protein [Vibrio fluvialis]MCE7581544.1 hypothetical protein [Vibrio fluvialis]
MQKVIVDGKEIIIKSYVYKTRYWRLVVFTVFLFVYSRTIGSDTLMVSYVGYFVVLSTSYLLLKEIYRLVFNPVLLSINFDGIFHHKVGFISWHDVTDIDYYSDRNKGLSITTTVPRLTCTRFLYLKLFESKSEVVRMDMSFSDCNVRTACERARIMYAWYKANQKAS